MNTYYVKILIFTFLINTLLLPQYENYQNNHYNIRLIPNNTQRTTIKSRLLTEIQKPSNPHYHNDPELKEIIDKLNEEAIKKYQKTHEPYEQLQDLVGKKGTKSTGRHDTEPIQNQKKDKYLKNIKHRCIGGICSCSVGSAFLTMLGLALAKTAAATYFTHGYQVCVSHMTIFNMFSTNALGAAIKTGTGICAGSAADVIGSASTMAINTFNPYGIAALVLIILVVALIILYIWLYRRRKNSWKHECKKHLCK
ncbi:hypothetical protein PFHG_05140 [Plasmodium falciparum HB3]|uniref:Stevor n=1 Tax=Plasmodium falciparum (isolate HB3) TaxID=137071 RepID=A0A0L7KJX0_PLAFX|nr:hypothetical protein PFHG_05140 [Plasmodium falciparum HB3]